MPNEVLGKEVAQNQVYQCSTQANPDYNQVPKDYSNSRDADTMMAGLIIVGGLATLGFLAAMAYIIINDEDNWD